jgi:hypothetical protein
MHCSNRDHYLAGKIAGWAQPHPKNFSHALNIRRLPAMPLQ